ncbi:hypothetical protein [Vineibacter terrae]|nr:hypothetical protein [Vineibacter terrae]
MPPLLLPLPAPPGPLPEAGGLLDQGAWLMAIFDLMQAEDARLAKRT